VQQKFASFLVFIRMIIKFTYHQNPCHYFTTF